MGQTINQVRHFYYAKNISSNGKIADTDIVGTILVKGDKDKKHLYFQYKSPDGIVRSDIIDTDKIIYAKATKAGDMMHYLKRVKISLDPNVNGGEPVIGQEYIIKVAFRQYIGLGDEDQYYKYASVVATPDMKSTGSEKGCKLICALAQALYKNLKADKNTKLARVFVNNGALSLVDDKFNPSLYTSQTSLEIGEAPQDWVLGMMPDEVIPFDVQLLPITYNGEEVSWGTVEELDLKTASTSPEDVDHKWTRTGNGHNVADLEYFCMGARGDLYRGMGYPNVIRTQYLVDPDKEYDLLDIHYYFSDSNEGVQKSEKTITIACECTDTRDASTSEDSCKLNTLIEKINGVIPTEKKIEKLDNTADYK